MIETLGLLETLLIVRADMTQLIVITPDDLKKLEQGKVLDCGEHIQIVCANNCFEAIDIVSESGEVNETNI